MVRDNASVRSETADDWNLHWDSFAKSALLNPAQHYRFSLMLDLLGECGMTKGIRLLDLGSGQGDFSVLVDKRFPGADIVGFELSESGVVISKEKLPTADFHVANLLEMSPDLDRYKAWAQMATCSEVLEHLDEPIEFLRSAGDYLSPGGILVITVPGGPMSAFDKYIGHRGHFSEKRLRQTVEASGLRVSRILKAGFPFFNIYRSTVIMRGRQLIRDAGQESMPPNAVRVMKLFEVLFKANLSNFPGGWQMVCIAHKPAA